MRLQFVTGTVLVFLFAASAPALATNYYYVGGPQPAVNNDPSWKWMEDEGLSGIDAVYEWIQTNGSGDWDIRVHSDYEEDVDEVSGGQINLTSDTVTVNTVQGGMKWETGESAPVNVHQELSSKSHITGSGDKVFHVHLTTITIDGFAVDGAVYFSTFAAGSVLKNCHLSGDGKDTDPRTGIHIDDHCHGVYVMNSLIEGFGTGLRYVDTTDGFSTYIVHSTIADNAIGISNDEEPWNTDGYLQLFNSIVTAESTPVELTADKRPGYELPNKRFYSSSDIYKATGGSFVFDGEYDFDNGGSITTDPLLQDFRLAVGSPCINSGATVDAGDFRYVNVNPSTGFQADMDVVVDGIAPGTAEYVILSDLDGKARFYGGQADMGAFEAVPEPPACVTLTFGLIMLRFLRRTRRRSLVR